MVYSFESLIRVSGTLIALNGAGTVEVTRMDLDSISKKKLAEVLRESRVDKNNQLLRASKITIKSDQAVLFLKGQSGYIRDGNGYSLTTNRRSPVRFKAVLEALVEGSDNLYYSCNIVLGSIEFDLQNILPTIDEDIGEAVFVNVPFTLYPFGTYECHFYRDE